MLTKKWSDGQPRFIATSWQLIVGGVLLAALVIVLEPFPLKAPSLCKIAGYAYLTLVGTALAYLLWLRGITLLLTRLPAFLGLLSPIVALAIGDITARETVTWVQGAGIAPILFPSQQSSLARHGFPPDRSGEGSVCGLQWLSRAGHPGHRWEIKVVRL